MFCAKAQNGKLACANHTSASQARLGISAETLSNWRSLFVQIKCAKRKKRSSNCTIAFNFCIQFYATPLSVPIGSCCSTVNVKECNGGVSHRLCINNSVAVLCQPTNRHRLTVRKCSFATVISLTRWKLFVNCDAEWHAMHNGKRKKKNMRARLCAYSYALFVAFIFIYVWRHCMRQTAGMADVWNQCVWWCIYVWCRRHHLSCAMQCKYSKC